MVDKEAAAEAACLKARAFVEGLELDQVVDQDVIDGLGREALDWLDDELERRDLDLKQGDECRRDQHRVVERLPMHRSSRKEGSS